LFPATEPGLYAVNQGDNRIHVAVNLTDRMFSDVNRSVFQDDKIAVSEQRLLRRELWFYMLFAAVALISAEWFTYHRRMTL